MNNYQYEQVMKNLETLHSTHPNLSQVWKEFINIKKERYEYALKTCAENINNMSDINDPSIDTLLFIMFFLDTNVNIT